MTYDKASYIMHHEYIFESLFPREISHLKSTVIQNSIYIWIVSSQHLDFAEPANLDNYILPLNSETQNKNFRVGA